MMMKQTENAKVDSEAQELKCWCERGHLADKGMFYTYKDGTRMNICKECLTKDIDVHNPYTFLDILQELDRPYIEEEWERLIERYPQKNGMGIMGRYLSKMKLMSFRNLTYEDSKELNERYKQYPKPTCTNIPTPEPDKIILFQFDMDRYDLDEIKDLYDILCAKFPDNKVIGLPINCQIKYFTREEFDSAIASLKECLDEEGRT